MKSQIVFLLVLILSCFACNKEGSGSCPEGLEEGEIIGQDFRKCACCGGWWIEIGTDTLRSFTLPNNVELDDNLLGADMAIPICISYEKATDCNIWEDLIEIKTIHLQ